MKKIEFQPNVPAEVRALPQQTAMVILGAIHRYAESGDGDVRALQGPLKGFLRLRVGDYRVVFREEAGALVIYRVRSRRDAYR